MMLRRRRPLMRAAMVGGAGYVAGKRLAEREQREAYQDQQLDELQAARYEQAPAPVAAAPVAAAAPTDRIEALTKLKSLLDAGVLSQTEFEQEKARILQGG